MSIDASQAVSAMIINYLNGSLEISELGVTRKNGRDLLEAVKRIDAEVQGKFFERSTYPIRIEILRVCSPEMQTSEAYTKTYDPKKMFDYKYLGDPSVWVPERVGLHAKLIANQFILARALSNRLRPEDPAVSAMRGGTAVGKTRHLNTAPMFRHALDDRGELSGVLSPDTIKGWLKKQSSVPLVNTQVYEEGTALFANFQQAISMEASQMKIIIDTRLALFDYFESSVIGPAKMRCGAAHLVDLDNGSLEASINRVLVRNPYEEAPCVPLHAIALGFIQIRENRRKFIDEIKGNASIESYKLYHNDESGNKILVAEKTQNQFQVLHEKVFEECLKTPSEAEIDQIFKQIITPEYIDCAIKKGDIESDQRPLLELWMGKTLEQAMGKHVYGGFAATPVWECDLSFVDRWAEEEMLYSPFVFTATDDGIGFPLAITDDQLIAYIDHLPRSYEIKKIDLNGCRRITDKSLFHVLKKCPFLLEIDISWCSQVMNQGLMALSYCRLLEKIRCQGCCRCSDEGFIALAKGCRNLKEVNFSGDTPCNIRSLITDKSLKALTQYSHSLEVVNFDLSPSITDEGIALLAQKCPLREVSLGWCRSLSDKAFTALAACEGLQAVSLIACKITGKALFEFRNKCSHLAKMNLIVSDISEEDQKVFLSSPPPALKEIAFQFGSWFYF
ncbi:MAG: hypothetical protein KGJ02_03880 [Verrucomicrobiota bacterium]|nr:hypothetical protein [Verrucomicrobiota bacterium]